MDQLRLLTVHAHPDDEASKGAATIAKYRSQGVRSTLVCCTGGEEGEILNPAMDRPDIRENIGEIRRAELDDAAELIGYDEVIMLGYRDSGMPDDDANAHPGSFARADLDEAIDRLVEILRNVRPHVVVTYSHDQQGYRHPDHLRVNAISEPARSRSGDAAYRPDLGEPWQVSKLYFTVWSRARIEALHAKFGELGLESPYDERWFTRPSHDDVITTKVEIGEWFGHRTAGLLAHATQVDPESKFWFGLPDDAAADAYPYDDYVLAESTVESRLPEDDLFAGIRESVAV